MVFSDMEEATKDDDDSEWIGARRCLICEIGDSIEERFGKVYVVR